MFTLNVTLSKGRVEKLMDSVDLAYRYLRMTRCYFHHEKGENNDDSVGDSGGLPSWTKKRRLCAKLGPNTLTNNHQ